MTNQSFFVDDRRSSTTLPPIETEAVPPLPASLSAVTSPARVVQQILDHLRPGLKSPSEIVEPLVHLGKEPEVQKLFRHELEELYTKGIKSREASLPPLGAQLAEALETLRSPKPDPRFVESLQELQALLADWPTFNEKQKNVLEKLNNKDFDTITSRHVIQSVLLDDCRDVLGVFGFNDKLHYKTLPSYSQPSSYSWEQGRHIPIAVRGLLKWITIDKWFDYPAFVENQFEALKEFRKVANQVNNLQSLLPNGLFDVPRDTNDLVREILCAVSVEKDALGNIKYSPKLTRYCAVPEVITQITLLHEETKQAGRGAELFVAYGKELEDTVRYLKQMIPEVQTVVNAYRLAQRTERLRAEMEIDFEAFLSCNEGKDLMELVRGISESEQERLFDRISASLKRVRSELSARPRGLLSKFTNFGQGEKYRQLESREETYRSGIFFLASALCTNEMMSVVRGAIIADAFGNLTEQQQTKLVGMAKALTIEPDVILAIVENLSSSPAARELADDLRSMILSRERRALLKGDIRTDVDMRRED
jgi:hypothetical protein